MSRVGRNYRWLAVLLFGLQLSGCATSFEQQKLVDKLDDPARPVIIDVRSKREYEQGHLPGAINISVFSLPFSMDEVGGDKERPVLVYCAHGPRAGLAGFFLRLAGYGQVYHLEGDWSGWRREGLPVETPNEPEAQGDGETPP